MISDPNQNWLVDMANTQPAYQRQGRSRAAEKADLVAHVRRSLSVTVVREHCRSSKEEGEG